MPDPRTLGDLETPAAVVDLDRMEANLDRMAEYASAHGLELRPHIKTHKTPELAAEQLRRGAVGVTVATVREAEVMSAVSDDILLAYPPVGAARLERLLALPRRVQLSVALDSVEALEALGRAARSAKRRVFVRIEVDVGMQRVGVQHPQEARALAEATRRIDRRMYFGLQFYPGHIREHVNEQGPALQRMARRLDEFLDVLGDDFPEGVRSGGSTPTAFRSHELEQMTEIRPGTYIFNDRTTAAIGACAWDDCAYSVLATVVSTAVPGQAVVDAGSKALFREDVRGTQARGFAHVLHRPDAVVKAMSEEHGLLELNGEWRPRVGERVRIVPNHVCVSVNLHDTLWGVRGEAIEAKWPIAARGWAKTSTPRRVRR